jgi:hypothetical protein
MDLKKNKRAKKRIINFLVGAKVLFQGFVCAQTKGENGTCNPNA